MDTQVETRKRLEIADKISSSLDGRVKGMMLGGSMGYGQNYSVTDKSDIDMVIVTDRNKINELVGTEYFHGRIPEEVLSLFKSGEINFFWVTQDVDSVEVNSFVYDMSGYSNFCLLTGGLKGFKNNKPLSETQQYGFEGNKLTIRRNVIPHNAGFIYEKPSLTNGKYWGGVPRQDFFYSGHVMIEESNFFTELEKSVWMTTVQQLIKEYGPIPNINEVNVLNTHFTYQTQRARLPVSVVDKIRERTKLELEKLKLS